MPDMEQLYQIRDEEQIRAAPKWFIQWVATPVNSAFCQDQEGLLYLSKRVNKRKYPPPRKGKNSHENS